MDKYLDIIANLLSLNDEYEWLDFKENWFDKDAIGEYISAVAYGACLCGKEYGYILWGIRDGSKEVIGTTINFDKDINHEPYKHYLARNLKPSLAFEVIEREYESKRIVLLQVPAQNPFKRNTRTLHILELDQVRKESISFQNGNSN